jgi:hypothetical protein
MQQPLRDQQAPYEQLKKKKFTKDSTAEQIFEAHLNKTEFNFLLDSNLPYVLDPIHIDLFIDLLSTFYEEELELLFLDIPDSVKVCLLNYMMKPRRYIEEFENKEERKEYILKAVARRKEEQLRRPFWVNRPKRPSGIPSAKSWLCINPNCHKPIAPNRDKFCSKECFLEVRKIKNTEARAEARKLEKSSPAEKAIEMHRKYLADLERLRDKAEREGDKITQRQMVLALKKEYRPIEEDSKIVRSRLDLQLNVIVKKIERKLYNTDYLIDY